MNTHPKGRETETSGIPADAEGAQLTRYRIRGVTAEIAHRVTGEGARRNTAIACRFFREDGQQSSIRLGGTSWPRCGDLDWREFLTSLDEGYVRQNLFGATARILSFSETRRTTQRFIKSLEAEGHMTPESLRMARNHLRSIQPPVDAADDAIDAEAIVRWGMRTFVDAEGSAFAGYREDPGVTRFFSSVWRPLMAQLCDELAAEAAANIPASEPDVEPSQDGYEM